MHIRRRVAHSHVLADRQRLSKESRGPRSDAGRPIRPKPLPRTLPPLQTHRPKPPTQAPAKKSPSPMHNERRAPRPPRRFPRSQSRPALAHASVCSDDRRVAPTQLVGHLHRSSAKPVRSATRRLPAAGDSARVAGAGAVGVGERRRGDADRLVAGSLETLRNPPGACTWPVRACSRGPFGSR